MNSYPENALPVITLRRFPFPYRAMMAICDDIDQMGLLRFRRLHRFMNTLEDTPIGPGLGLDIADSLWFFHQAFAGRSLAQEPMSYFAGLDPSTRAAHSDELLHYVHEGWIDSLHTYGNFSKVEAADARFTRAHAIAALDVVNREALDLKVWINHGDTNNVQNMGSREFMHGDDPDNDAYHADLLEEAGFTYLWSSKETFEFGSDSKVSEVVLKNGRKFWEFSRFQNLSFEAAVQHGLLPAVAAQIQRRLPYAVLWHPQNLHVQLSDSNLEALVREQRFAIVAQHLGATVRLQRLGAPAIDALRRVKEFQERGEILIARTRRLLDFNRARDTVEYVVGMKEGRMAIDIVSVERLPDCRERPTLEEVRGLTFNVPRGMPIELQIGGVPVPEQATMRTDGDESTIGVRWHPADVHDHTQAFPDPKRGRNRRPRRGEITADKLAPAAVAALEDARTAIPADTDPAAYQYAVDYSIRMYGEPGVAGCKERLDALGFAGLQRGLDIGSGPGHWSMAFAQSNDAVEGIDVRHEFVHLSQRVATATGYASRVRFADGRAEELPYSDASFDAVWSHSVLMFTHTGQALRESARVLRPGAVLYCGYSTLGFRLSALRNAFAGGREPAIRSAAANLWADRLQRAGLGRTRWSNVRTLTLDELIRAADAFGLTFVDEPGIQDLAGTSVAGERVTFDALFKRDRDPEELMAVVTSSSFDNTLIDRLQGLVDADCGRVVAEAIEQRTDSPLDDPQVARLYARALIRGLRASEARTEALTASLGDPLIRGLYYHDCGNFSEALTSYDALPTDERPIALGAAALMQLARYDEAETRLRAGAENPATALDAGAGLIELARRRNSYEEAFGELTRLLRVVEQGATTADEEIADRSALGVS